MAEFDEDEHADDKSRKVTVTALTLTDTKSEEVVTEDVTLVFGDEVACVDHQNTTKVLCDRDGRRLTRRRAEEQLRCAHGGRQPDARHVQH